MLRRMQLNAACARVLGSLVEKGLATPQQYPLTINALQSACNQTSNREPVVSYDETTVLAALDDFGPHVQRELASRLGVDPSDMVKVLDELTARAIAEEAGVDDFLAEATPEDKMALIKKE